MRLLNIFHPWSIAHRRPTALIEFLFPIFLIAQGLTWLRVGDVFTLSSNYNIMQSIAPEETWGAAWVILAVAVSILTLTGEKRARRLSLSVSAALPLFVALSFYASNPLATTGIPFFASGIAALCVMVEVR